MIEEIIPHSTSLGNTNFYLPSSFINAERPLSIVTSQINNSFTTTTMPLPPTHHTTTTMSFILNL